MGYDLLSRKPLFSQTSQDYSSPVGSKTFDGVRFVAWTNDHEPPHVHGIYGSAEVLMELIYAEKVEDREVRLADRSDNIRPKNARKSDVRRVRRVATECSAELFALWEDARP